VRNSNTTTRKPVATTKKEPVAKKTVTKPIAKKTTQPKSVLDKFIKKT
jgi:hypothetical protein